MSERVNGLLSGSGGLSLFWQAWRPAERPRGVVVIAHGAGEHSDRYAHVAARLTAAGDVVHALDHRGHGRSQGAREVIADVDDAVADLDRLVELAVEAHPGVPVVLLGHSMGGMLAIRYAIRHQDRLAGLILSGPLAQIDGPGAAIPLIRAIAAVAPALPLVALDAAHVSRDAAVVDAYRSDPLVHHGRLPAATVAAMLTTTRGFPDTVAAITIPTLIVYGTADKLCPPAGSHMLAQRIGARDLTVKAYDGLYHEVLNEPERETVLDDIAAWLDTHLPRAAEVRVS
jgi:alpha-beta hydrolase superfamily lysophospholipase